MGKLETTGQGGGTSKKLAIAIFGVLLSAGGLFYAFHGVKFSELWDSTSRIQWIPLLLSILVYWGGVVVARAFLVQYLMRHFGSLKWIRAYRCLGIGFLANNSLPFRMGDLARSAAISKGAQIPFSTVVGGLAVERILDLAMVALIGFAALQVAPLPGEVRTFVTISGIVLGIGFFVLIIVARSSKEKNILGKSKLGRFIWSLWLKFSAGFNALENFRGVGVVIFLGMSVWACVLGSFTLKLNAFGLEGNLSNSLVLATCLGAGVALPSAPGYVGVYHAAAAFAVSSFGVDPVIAAAFGLFSWVIDIICGNIAGMLGMIFEGMTFSDLKRAGELKNEGA